MTIGSKEHYEIMEQFERDYDCVPLAKEDKSMWKEGYFYQNGDINNLFKAYSKGYSLARSKHTGLIASGTNDELSLNSQQKRFESWHKERCNACIAHNDEYFEDKEDD